MSNPNIIDAEDVSDVPALREATAVEKPAAQPESRVLTLLDRAFIDNPYIGAADIELTKEQEKVLERYRQVPHDWIEIKPDDGLIYMGHMRYRQVANEAFGPGKWALVPAGDFKVEDNGRVVTLYRTYRFYVNGKFLREAVGAGQYFKANSKMNFADAAETCESDVLKRMFKPFGIAGQCWDRRYQEWFKATYCKKLGSDWKRVKWDEAGWWDGKTKDLDPELEPPTTTPSTRARPVYTGIVTAVDFKDRSGERFYSIEFDGGKEKFWTDSELVYRAANDMIGTGRPVSIEYETKGKGKIIHAWDITE